MNQKYVSYINPDYLGCAAQTGGLGAGLGIGLTDRTPSLPETIGAVGGAALGAIPGIYGGAYADKLISPRNSNIGNLVGLMIAAGLPITGALIGKGIGDSFNSNP